MDPTSTAPPRSTATSAPRKRAAHLGPERRRPAVLDAALTLFLEHGYDGTSMEAVAEAAGVTKPVVYDCFPGKEELMRAVLAREERRILAEIAAAVADVDLDDSRSTMVEGYTAFLRAAAASPGIYRLIFLDGGGNAAVARRIQRGRREQVEVLGGLARRWLERRSTAASAAELDAKARLFGHVLVGFAETGARMLLSEDGWTPESLGRELARLAGSAQAAI